MAEHDDWIRERISGFSDDESQQQLVNQRQAAEEVERQHLAQQESQREGLEVVRLCGEFTTWASENGLPYDSPSPFARGWLLGVRAGEPSGGFSMHGDSVSWNTDNCLLLQRRKGIVGELAVNISKDLSFPFDAVQYDQRRRLAKKANPEDYTVESVVDSIARMAKRHSVDWR